MRISVPCLCVKTNNRNDYLTCLLQISDASLLTNGAAFVKRGITFAAALAKQLDLFTSLPCDLQHNQIKTSVIEMCIVLEAIQNETNDSKDIDILATNADSVIKQICIQGLAIVNKFLTLDITQSEYSLLLTLILFCSGNYSIQSTDFNYIGMKFFKFLA